MAVLHSDIHHGNILDFGERGWLAIDPKGLVGESGFDYANLFCNPDHAKRQHQLGLSGELKSWLAQQDWNASVC